jgi:RNA polymerase sigma-70 factor (ECF subfamily)
MTNDPKQKIAEQILVMRCQMGDEPALERLIALYQARLGYFIRRMIGSNQEAADILQEVWLVVFRKIGTLANPAAFRTWLYSIARNKTYKAVVKKNVWVPLEDNMESIDQDTEKDTFTPEDAENIHMCLNKIPPQHREVLILRFMENMSYEEIARTINSSLGTVRSRLFYAKKSLKRTMENLSHD